LGKRIAFQSEWVFSGESQEGRRKGGRVYAQDEKKNWTAKNLTREGCWVLITLRERSKLRKEEKKTPRTGFQGGKNYFVD